ncbi:RNA polymerase sigma factor [Desulfoscipio geothermicus]|uniref:RNA polymerase sigma-70 factor, ECF subfamily n=1 Tax=Desulfoscipio geothermicus DSM 3669 TaxID=1121426 RepID=A0A1I6D501_9FIRM|nr:RNA polymerase sigma factor [Desulfoscipio geothermicus]SFR00576.1 RNA polymerase sigma-70 factor, ECF subfamily [Desulfoscipio geothermicus DSM 3669]
MAMSTIEKLYQRYRISIFRYLYRMGGDYHLADELTQETFCRAFVSLDGFRGESALSTWLFRIAYYVYTGYLRGCPGERNLPLNHDIPDVNSTSDPARHLEEVENLRLVRLVLEQLPVDYRAVIILREVEGLTFEEIGAILGKSPAAARVTLFRARQKFYQLHKQLEGDDHD